MTRPASEGNELQKGFQTARRHLAARRARTHLTLLMAAALILATLIAVATVSIEMAKASLLF